MQSNLTPERRAEIEQILAEAMPGERTAINNHVALRRYDGSFGYSSTIYHVLSGSWDQQYAEARFIAAAPTIIRELLNALDAEHRQAFHAQFAADRIWGAFDALQRRHCTSADYLTRAQVVGVVQESD